MTKEIKVYCSDKKHDYEIWRSHWLKAVADIYSERRIAYNEAEELLRKSNIDNPVSLNEVDYWVEE